MDSIAFHCYRNLRSYIYGVVFSLSHRDKIWKEYILEVNRCPVTNGTLKVAETSKSLKERFSILRDYLEEQVFKIFWKYFNFFYALLILPFCMVTLKILELNLVLSKLRIMSI